MSAEQLPVLDGSWRDHAACLEVGVEPFFPEPETRGAAAPAIAVCERCPVRAACLADALARQEPHGVRGGLTSRQRARTYGENGCCANCAVAMPAGSAPTYCSPACATAAYPAVRAA